jgi:metal-responsive CopG/Arc/MetJ family transcriptional regulator
MRNGVIFQLVLSEDLNQQVNDFRFENRISSRSEAFRMLVERGLAAKPKKARGNAG